MCFILKRRYAVPVSDFLPGSICSLQLVVASYIFAAEWRAASGMLLVKSKTSSRMAAIISGVRVSA